VRVVNSICFISNIMSVTDISYPVVPYACMQINISNYFIEHLHKTLTINNKDITNSHSTQHINYHGSPPPRIHPQIFGSKALLL
jgi:hypothetical protein